MNYKDWRNKIKRLYVVFWEEYATVKIGVEATEKLNRINLWKSCGADLVCYFELPPEAENIDRKKVYYVEQAIKKMLGRQFLHPDETEWLSVVPLGWETKKSDGYSETFVLPDARYLAKVQREIRKELEKVGVTDFHCKKP